MDINQNLNSLLTEAKKMQERMQKAQDDLIKLKVKGEAGGGLVVIEMDGRHNITSVKISNSLMSDPDPEMIADLVMAAANKAAAEVEEASKKEIANLTRGLQIPTDFLKDKEEKE